MSTWLIVLLIPGQDMALILTTTTLFGAVQAMKLVAGICFALALYILITSSSLGIILAQSPKFFLILQRSGAAYLTYLAILLLKNSFQRKIIATKDSNSQIDTSHFQWVRVGFTSTILNPKVLIFFISIFSVFMTKDTSVYCTLFKGIGILLQTYIFYWIFTKFLSSKNVGYFLKEQSRKIEFISGIILLFIAFKIFTH